MKVLKWIPFLLPLVLQGQVTRSNDSFGDSRQINSISSVDSSLFQRQQNSFLEEDDLLLFGFDPFEETLHSNIGSLRIPIWWKPKNHLNLKIGDRLIEASARKTIYAPVFKENFPHTKIIYAPTFVEGQKLHVIHQRPYKFGSVMIDYDRVVSEGYLIHEKNKSSQFSVYGNFKHPKTSYTTEWRIHAFKNETNWNGGITDDELFLSNSVSNWQLLPIKWANLNSISKRKGIDWKHSYRYSEPTEIEYELNVSRDSLFYNDLHDDVLIFPVHTDSSSSHIRVFTNTNHTLRWKHKLDRDKKMMLGLGYQNFDSDASDINQFNIYTSISSLSRENEISFTFGRTTNKRSNYRVDYLQNVKLIGVNHEFRLGIEKKLPNWMMQNSYNPQGSNSSVSDFPESSSNRFLEWDVKLGSNLYLQHAYYNIRDYHYYNASAVLKTSEKTIQIFQSRLKHKIHYKKWNWTGEVGYQNCSSAEIPMVEFLAHQKIYWEGNILKKATLTQLGTRIRYKSAHPGMTYSPFIGDYLVNPSNETDASHQFDLFANFQIKMLKVHLTYLHFNALGQGNQYILKPYPMTKPVFKMSLIWNFYD
jgi:hypothetical protein